QPVGREHHRRGSALHAAAVQLRPVHRERAGPHLRDRAAQDLLTRPSAIDLTPVAAMRPGFFFGPRRYATALSMAPRMSERSGTAAAVSSRRDSSGAGAPRDVAA